MSRGEGGTWCGWDMTLRSEFQQLISLNPLLAFKILTLEKIVTLGGLPLVQITLNNEVVFEGDFDGVIFERGNFKLDIHIPSKKSIEIKISDVKNIFVIDQDSAQITEESIARSLKLDQEIAKYFHERKVAGGGVI